MFFSQTCRQSSLHTRVSKASFLHLILRNSNTLRTAVSAKIVHILTSKIHNVHYFFFSRLRAENSFSNALNIHFLGMFPIFSGLICKDAVQASKHLSSNPSNSASVEFLYKNEKSDMRKINAWSVVRVAAFPMNSPIT